MPQGLPISISRRVVHEASAIWLALICLGGISGCEQAPTTPTFSTWLAEVEYMVPRNVGQAMSRTSGLQDLFPTNIEAGNQRLTAFYPQAPEDHIVLPQLQFANYQQWYQTEEGQLIYIQIGDYAFDTQAFLKLCKDRSEAEGNQQLIELSDPPTDYLKLWKWANASTNHIQLEGLRDYRYHMSLWAVPSLPDSELKEVLVALNWPRRKHE